LLIRPLIHTGLPRNILNIHFYSRNRISSSASMERTKSVYVKFIKRFWIWQEVYGIDNSRWSQALLTSSSFNVALCSSIYFWIPSRTMWFWSVHCCTRNTSPGTNLNNGNRLTSECTC
jgi:hypothetical protein